MLDKFMELSTRILKALSLEYEESYPISGGERVGKLRFHNAISGTPSDIYVIADHPLSKYIVVQYKFVGWKPKHPIDRASSGVYMDTIYILFNKHVVSIESYENNKIFFRLDKVNINYMIDELLNYSDEELKLYISLL